MRRFNIETDNVSGCSFRILNATLTRHTLHQGALPSQMQSGVVFIGSPPLVQDASSPYFVVP